LAFHEKYRLRDGLFLGVGAAQASAKQPSTTNVVAASGDAVLDLGALPRYRTGQSDALPQLRLLAASQSLARIVHLATDPALLCGAWAGRIRRAVKIGLSTGLE